MNANLEYLADSLIIEALAKNDSIITTAQFADNENAMGSVAGGVKRYVMSLYDKDHPIASIAAFMGRGILWSLGFKWMSVLYTVAEALGFDWRPFWSAIGKGIAGFVKSCFSSDGKIVKQIPEDHASSVINDLVSSAFQANFTGELDSGKLSEIARNKFSSEMKNALEVKAIALRLQNDPSIIKEAGTLSLFKGKLSRFFIKIIGWLVKTALISLGLVAGAGAVSTLVGFNDNSEENADGVSGEDPNAPIHKLKMSTNVSRELFVPHSNNLSNVWIESGDIQNIENIIMNWISGIYPQLTKTNIRNSSAFSLVVDKFKNRNKLASGLGMFSVPRPYQSKADVVSAIVNEFLKESPQEGK